MNVRIPFRSRIAKFTSYKSSHDIRVVLFFLICLTVYTLIAWDRNFQQSPFRHHVLFADAYLNGHLGIEHHEIELQQVGNQFYNPQGPMPALLLMPLVFIFGITTSDYSFGIFLAAITATMFMQALSALKGPYVRSASDVWTYSVLFALGTIQSAYAVNGRFWFLSQLTAVFFVVLFLLIWFRFGDRPWGPLAAGLAIGASLLARYHAIILASAFVLYALFERGVPLQRKVLRLTLFGAGIGLFVGAVLFHNYLRFGSSIETGYSAFNAGTYFELGKIGPHLSCVFFAMPELRDHFPYFAFPLEGLSMLLITPLYFYLLRIDYHTPLQRSVGIACLLFFIFLMGYHTNGLTQFGYRYFLEFNPLLILLLALAGDQIPKRKLFYTLLVYGIVINALGGFTHQRPAISELFFTAEGSFIKNLNY